MLIMDYARPRGVGWGVAWLGLQREADFRKKRAPRCSHSTVLIHGPPMDPQGAPKGPQENPRYSSNYRADKPGNPEPDPARSSKSLKPGNLLYGMDYARPGGVDWGVRWASVGRRLGWVWLSIQNR